MQLIKKIRSTFVVLGVLLSLQFAYAGGGFSCLKDKSSDNLLGIEGIVREFTKKSCIVYGDKGDSPIKLYAFGETHTDVPVLEKRGEVFAKMMKELLEAGRDIVFVHEMLDDGRSQEYNSDEEKKRAFLNDVLYMNVGDSVSERENLKHISFSTWEPKSVQKEKNQLRRDVIRTLEESQLLLTAIEEYLKTTSGGGDFDPYSDGIMKLKERYRAVNKSHNYFNKAKMNGIVCCMGDCRNEAIADSIQKVLSESEEGGPIYFYIAGRDHLTQEANQYMLRFKDGVPGLKVIIPNTSTRLGVPKEGLWHNLAVTEENLDRASDLLWPTKK
ncbi:MAG: hypothetical protein HQK50_11305 [Oligoflexia bacterium]|nr:hypothetical protein [Oligoflexia bacterium]MBF0366151.1 hypothetical protein [Oligoflexia bacterium]